MYVRRVEVRKVKLSGKHVDFMLVTFFNYFTAVFSCSTECITFHWTSICIVTFLQSYDANLFCLNFEQHFVRFHLNNQISKAFWVFEKSKVLHIVSHHDLERFILNKKIGFKLKKLWHKPFLKTYLPVPENEFLVIQLEAGD